MNEYLKDIDNMYKFYKDIETYPNTNNIDDIYKYPYYDNQTYENILEFMKKVKPKEEQWLEELEAMDITIVEQFLRKKKLERIKDIDK
jgi:cephalosporin-C deacetylase-like acetyl esterase